MFRGLGSRVQGLGVRVQGVEGLGLRCLGFTGFMGIEWLSFVSFDGLVAASRCCCS